MPSNARSSHSNLDQILRLEVPVVVRLGERGMTVSEVVALVPGAIIELPKPADSELDLMVNNKPIGQGVAVKVGENFGIKVTFIGDLSERIKAMGALTLTVTEAVDGNASDLADRLLSGQAA
ncbi:MAG: FliM/FliN family flagellar motor switch protein [Phycisphaerales bacterium]|nr:FliM/FliN family flagellar motor switch protein [Phycisphaerales bacterium]